MPGWIRWEDFPALDWQRLRDAVPQLGAHRIQDIADPTGMANEKSRHSILMARMFPARCHGCVSLSKNMHNLMHVLHDFWQ